MNYYKEGENIADSYILRYPSAGILRAAQESLEWVLSNVAAYKDLPNWAKIDIYQGFTDRFIFKKTLRRPLRRTSAKYKKPSRHKRK